MILLSFRSVFAVPRLGEDVDILHTFATLKKFDVPLDVEKYVKKYQAAVAKSPYKGEVKPLDEVSADIRLCTRSILSDPSGLDTVNYGAYRLPLDEICIPIAEMLLRDLESCPNRLPHPICLWKNFFL